MSANIPTTISAPSTSGGESVRNVPARSGERQSSGRPWNESKPYTSRPLRAAAMAVRVRPVYTPNSSAIPSSGASLSA